MKKIIVAFSIILLAWNIVLTMTIIDLNNKQNEKETLTTIKQLSTEFETDYKVVIEEVKEKTVGIGCEGRTSNGIIYGKTEDGGIYVISRYSFITSDKPVSLIFANNEKVETEIVGYDLYSDICLLKAYPPFNVDSFVLGDSDVVKEGEYALIVSSRATDDYFGYYSSCMVSGVNRIFKRDIDADSINDYDLPFIQVDSNNDNLAAGSALVNLNGELIGVVSMPLTSTTNEVCAIKINEIKLIVDGIINGQINRYNQRCFVKDIKYIPLYLRSNYGVAFDIVNGLVVTIVNDENSGFMVGDVITKIDGKNITSIGQYRSWLYSNDLETNEFTINRKGEEIKLIIGNLND